MRRIKNCVICGKIFVMEDLVDLYFRHGVLAEWYFI